MTDYSKPGSGWIPLQAACQRLGVSDQAAKRRIQKGELQGAQQDGRWYASEASIDAVETTDELPPGEWVSRMILSQFPEQLLWSGAKELGVTTAKLDAAIDPAREVAAKARARQSELL